MQKRIQSIALTAALIFSFLNWNCTKLDTTNIGSDLLPAVDNVHTFDTLLNINSTQGFFSDSSTFISAYEDMALGAINFDPLFGKTNANIDMQFKPSFFPYYFGNPGDTLVGFDSVVLCLKLKRFWGDTLQPVFLEVREINDTKFRDSGDVNNPTNYQPSYGPFLASKSVDVRTLGNYVKFTNGRDSVNYQVRIKLPTAWGMQLFGRDSTVGNPGNNAFYNDSIYRRFYNGIAVLASGAGNGLMYVNLSDTATKLEVHYRKKNNGVTDSVYTSIRVKPSLANQATEVPRSNTVNNIIRNRTGYPVSNPNSDEHYLQASPGSYVNLDIPGLATLSNRIIHRAEIIVEQIPTDPIYDEIFSSPNFLYLDLKDTGTTDKWKPVYLDLNTTEFYDPDQLKTIQYIPRVIDFQYFGGFTRTKKDVFGNYIQHYNFNISRYVQHIVTKKLSAYNMRIYAPFNINYPQISPSYIPYGNNIALGRVRIGSGSNPNYKLRLRIVYSKL